MGALKLLADSYSPEELNEKGFALYAEFRPEVERWGGRGEVRCDKILVLRKKQQPSTSNAKQQTEAIISQGRADNHNIFVEVEHRDFRQELRSMEDDEPKRKKTRGLSLEEYEAALDQDSSFDDVEF